MTGPILIPCGGSGERWGNFRGSPKQLTHINRRPLLSILVERLREAGADSIGIIATDRRFDVGGALLLPPNPAPLGSDVDKVWCSRPYWSCVHRTWIVWGDVYLTRAGARIMLEPDQPPLLFYGRPGRGMQTGKPYQEIWGLSFEPEAHTLLSEATLAAHNNVAGGAPARAWEVRHELRRATGDRYDLCVINDRTEDFDFPWDLGAWEKLSERFGY